MKQLQQLESNLIQKQNECDKILAQINLEKYNNQINLLQQFEYPIGKCFKENDSKFDYYKIIKLVRTSSDGNPIYNVIRVDVNGIYYNNILHNIAEVIEIESSVFEIHTMVAINNLIMSADLKLTKKSSSSRLVHIEPDVFRRHLMEGLPEPDNDRTANLNGYRTHLHKLHGIHV